MTDTPASVDADSSRPPRPRIRTGAVIWGLVLVVCGAGVLWVASSPARRADTVERVLALDGFGWTVVTLVGVGGLLTLIALAAVIRSVQDRLRPGRSARSDA